MPTPGGKILIVDDEAGLCLPLAAFLRGQGLDATALTDGNEALRCLREAPCSLLLLDLNMPRVGGLEIARQAHADHPGIRIIFLTGELESDDLAERLAEFPSALVLHKPFDLRRILAIALGDDPGCR